MHTSRGIFIFASTKLPWKTCGFLQKLPRKTCEFPQKLPRKTCTAETKALIIRMFRRKIEKTLLEWKQSPTKMPLIIKGCRQCGKTFSVLNFAQKHYGNVHTSPLYGFPPQRLLTVTKTMPCTPAAGLSPHLGDNPWYITDTCEQSVLKTLRKTRQVICGCCSPTTSLLSDISSYPSR